MASLNSKQRFDILHIISHGIELNVLFRDGIPLLFNNTAHCIRFVFRFHSQELISLLRRTVSYPRDHFLIVFDVYLCHMFHVRYPFPNDNSVQKCTLYIFRVLFQGSINVPGETDGSFAVSYEMLRNIAVEICLFRTSKTFFVQQTYYGNTWQINIVSLDTVTSLTLQ